MSTATLRQAPPVPGGRPVLPYVRMRLGATYPALVEAIEARADVGEETYGVRGVHVPDGRLHGVDCYQELLDALHYALAVEFAANAWGDHDDEREWASIADRIAGLAAVVRAKVER